MSRNGDFMSLLLREFFERVEERDDGEGRDGEWGKDEEAGRAASRFCLVLSFALCKLSMISDAGLPVL